MGGVRTETSTEKLAGRGWGVWHWKYGKGEHEGGGLWVRDPTRVHGKKMCRKRGASKENEQAPQWEGSNENAL